MCFNEEIYFDYEFKYVRIDLESLDYKARYPYGENLNFIFY
jgi:hypothetical protein